MRISVTSREFVHVPVVASADPTGNTVEIAVIDAAGTVVDDDFQTAEWDTLGSDTTAKVLVGPGGSPSIGTFVAGPYDAYVRVTDNPETPVLYAGTITFF